MKSIIIVFLLLLTTIVGCGQASNIEGGEDGGQKSSPELKQEGEQDSGEDKDKDEKDKDEKDDDDDD
jgi:hypothetical protein